MALKRADTLASVVIPDLECTVHGSSDQLGIVKMKGTNTQCMARQRAETFTRLDIPDLGRVVVGACDQERVVKLKTHHSICMSSEGLDLEVTLPPVSLDNQPFRIDLLPGPFHHRFN